MGNAEIQDVEFRVVLPAARRELGRAQQLHPRPERSVRVVAGSDDDADAIQDPVLQKIYRLSRKRATA